MREEKEKKVTLVHISIRKTRGETQGNQRMLTLGQEQTDTDMKQDKMKINYNKMIFSGRKKNEIIFQIWLSSLFLFLLIYFADKKKSILLTDPALSQLHK